MTKLIKETTLLLFVAAFAIPVSANDKSSAHETGGTDKQAEMGAMFAEMMKFAAPGEHHNHLNPLAGKWSLNCKFRMAPEMPWDLSTGQANFEWILGGRHLKQEVTSPPSDSFPMTFEGFGLLGYDNYAGEYIGIWTDTYFTGAMVFRGQSDDSGKTITLTGEYDNFMKGGAKTKSRWVYKIINDDKFVFEMWELGENGSDYMSGEITYSRVR